MSETPDDANPFAGVTWPESYPDASQSANNCQPAVTTLTDATPAENGVSGAIQARTAPNGEYIPLGAEWSELEQKVVPMGLVREESVPSLNPDDADEIPVTMSQIGLPKHAESAKHAKDAANPDEFKEIVIPMPNPDPSIFASINRHIGVHPELAKKYPEQAKQAREALEQWAKEYGEAARKMEDFIPVRLGEVMRACNMTDDEAPATGTEAQVCRDIAKRQRRGLAKYGVTVIGNNLSFAQWLQHFYEELLDASVYAKRILTMTHEPENENQSDAGAAGVLPDNASPPNRHRKPGAGRKAKPCPGCGATKSIGSTVKAGIPTRRCKQCGFVVRQYHHLANAAKAPA